MCSRSRRCMEGVRSGKPSKTDVEEGRKDVGGPGRNVEGPPSLNNTTAEVQRAAQVRRRQVRDSPAPLARRQSIRKRPAAAQRSTAEAARVHPLNIIATHVSTLGRQTLVLCPLIRPLCFRLHFIAGHGAW